MLIITTRDELGYKEYNLTEYKNVVCDGQYLLFTDDNGKDYRVNILNVFEIRSV